MNDNDKYKRYSEYFLLSILILIPKIDLISFPHIWQGIRLEDLVVLYLAFILIYYNKVAINKKDVGFNFILFFFIYMASSIIASVYFKQQWVILIRYIEYIVIIIYFNRNLINTKTIFKILRIYLLLNLIMVVLQNASLVGEFSSIGYESPFNKTDDRPTGLTGGPWELANCSAIIFFCLLIDEKQSKHSKIFYSLIALFLIAITHSRTVILAMSIVLLFYIVQKHITKKQLLPMIILISIVTFISYFYFFQNINSIYSQIPGIFMEVLINQEEVSEVDLDGKLWSMVYRINFWLHYYKLYTTDLITLIFGIGVYGMYMESALLRILFGSGIMGLIFVIYSVRRVPLYMLLYLFISGLTLDLMLSFKIFFTIFIYFYLIKNVSNENRN